MAAFNAEQFITQAVESLLAQSFKDFELIIVNDGSRDATGTIAEQFSRKDHRVRVFHQENAGISSALNACLREARGEFMAIADSDDIQLPNRLELQMRVFESDPRIDVCGGGVQIVSGDDDPGKPAIMPGRDGEIRAGMPFESMLFNPTVTYRRSILGGPVIGYNPAFRMAIDYDFFARLPQSVRFNNCAHVLTRYRRHPEQITLSSERSGRSREERFRVWSHLLPSILGAPADAESLEYHFLAASWPQHFTIPERTRVGRWLEQLWRCNQASQKLPSFEFGFEVAQRWLWACSHGTDDGFGALRAYLRSPLSRLPGLRWRMRASLPWRCIRPHS